MAHTLANDKAIVLCDSSEPEIVIIDPDQEAEIARLREQLAQSWKVQDRYVLDHSGSPTPVLKRKRVT